MKRIVIRCDASQSIGSGHVMRCRTLARVLRQRGAEICFLCRRQPGDLISLLEEEFTVIALPEQPLTACKGLKRRELYEAWLGCSQEEDAAQCIEVLNEANIHTVDWLVVDHYGIDTNWESKLLSGLTDGLISTKLLIIDDLADRPHQGNLLLDQNFFGNFTARRYQGLVSDQCRQLLGPHYALLAPEYTHLHKLIPSRKQFKRVLVFLGGVDKDNLTAVALEALTDPALAMLAVDVVTGSQSPHRTAVEKLAAKRPFTTVHSSLPSLAGLIARADLSIGAGGTTTWERLCLRLPSLVVAIADNQISCVKELDHAGYLQFLGDQTNVTVEQIRSTVLANISNPLPQEDISILTDGWGAPRVAIAMLGNQGTLSLRPANATDEALLFRWANPLNPSIKSSSADSKKAENYHLWFQKGLTNTNRLHFIATATDGCPIGQVRVDRQSSNNEAIGNEASIDLTLDPFSRTHGLESKLIKLILQTIEKHWGYKIDSVMDRDPTDSNACFSRADFSKSLEFDSDNTSPLSANNSLALAPSYITLFSDHGSWLNEHMQTLIKELWLRGHAVRWIHKPAQLVQGDVCLLLSCGSLLSEKQLAMHSHNLVVHASDLPKGQGWSPMTWQILEGECSIPLSLFEAATTLDTGSIYLQKRLILQGHELVKEWQTLQAQATLELCLDWFDHYKTVVSAAQPQHGESSNYRRRRPYDSQLDLDRPLAAQFNLLRVVDNDRYPAFFQWHDRTFFLHIQAGSDNS